MFSFSFAQFPDYWGLCCCSDLIVGESHVFKDCVRLCFNEPLLVEGCDKQCCYGVIFLCSLIVAVHANLNIILYCNVALKITASNSCGHC